MQSNKVTQVLRCFQTTLNFDQANPCRTVFQTMKLVEQREVLKGGRWFTQSGLVTLLQSHVQSHSPAKQIWIVFGTNYLSRPSSFFYTHLHRCSPTNHVIVTYFCGRHSHAFLTQISLYFEKFIVSMSLKLLQWILIIQNFPLPISFESKINCWNHSGGFPF